MAIFSNTVARRIARKTIFSDIQALVTPSTSFNQGDLLYYNSSSKLVALPVGETDGATFLGISPIKVVNGKLPPVYVTDTDASVHTPSLAGPEYGDEHFVNLKAGDSLSPGSLVYLDPADGTNWVQASGTKPIGVYSGAAITAPVGGAVISILIGARYPSDDLRF